MTDVPEELRQEVEKWRNLKRERPEHIEVPGPGQESVWDYPRPPRVEAVDYPIRVEFVGIIIANSVRAYRVLETSGPPVYYLSPGDVRQIILNRVAIQLYANGKAWVGTGRFGLRTVL